jgi:hypothetical protein
MSKGERQGAKNAKVGGESKEEFFSTVLSS